MGNVAAHRRLTLNQITASSIERRTPQFQGTQKISVRDIKDSILEINMKAGSNTVNLEKQIDRAADAREREVANQVLINSKPFYEDY